ncbi:MAG: insulinase family protein, partial [Gammaproteobacteria bacterium]|nr:insulinase family protein [Gammaproteobacteria bacterium]
QYFGAWKENRMAVPEKNIAEVAMKEGSVYLIDKPGAPQSLILAGHVAPSTGADNNIDILTMNDVIGGSFTARVNMNLREDKGWAYGAYTFMQDARGQRPWLAYAPVQTDKTADSIKELTREMDEFLSSAPARQEELDKSVRNNVNSLPGQFETAGAVLNALLSNDRFGRPDSYISSLKRRYEAVDLSGVHAAAEQVIHPENLIWLIVGDLEKIEQQIRDLELGDVQVIDENGKPIATSG